MGAERSQGIDRHNKDARAIDLDEKRPGHGLVKDQAKGLDWIEKAEEYVASGQSIKKAQHAAAAIALERTNLKHPPPKQKVTKSGEFEENFVERNSASFFAHFPQ